MGPARTSTSAAAAAQASAAAAAPPAAAGTGCGTAPSAPYTAMGPPPPRWPRGAAVKRPFGAFHTPAWRRPPGRIHTVWGLRRRLKAPGRLPLNPLCQVAAAFNLPPLLALRGGVGKANPAPLRMRRGPHAIPLQSMRRRAAAGTAERGKRAPPSGSVGGTSAGSDLPPLRLPPARLHKGRPQWSTRARQLHGWIGGGGAELRPWARTKWRRAHEPPRGADSSFRLRLSLNSCGRTTRTHTIRRT